MSRKLFTLLGLVLIPSIALTACGGDPQRALCNAIDQLTIPIENLAGITENASTAEVKQLLEKVDEPMQALNTANQALNREGINDLVTTYDELVAEVEALPEGAPLGEAAQRLVATSERVQSAFEQATSALNCNK